MYSGRKPVGSRHHHHKRLLREAGLGGRLVFPSAVFALRFHRPLNSGGFSFRRFDHRGDHGVGRWGTCPVGTAGRKSYYGGGGAERRGGDHVDRPIANCLDVAGENLVDLSRAKNDGRWRRDGLGGLQDDVLLQHGHGLRRGDGL